MNDPNEESYIMNNELVDLYAAEPQKDGRVRVSILIPKRFAALWLFKLDQLRATQDEIKEWSEVELRFRGSPKE
jgi:hypothetical protein